MHGSWSAKQALVKSSCYFPEEKHVDPRVKKMRAPVAEVKNRVETISGFTKRRLVDHG